MSFPRAAIKRFNEHADNSIPPPGAYDPKFVTDVAVSSTPKNNSFYDKWGRPPPANNSNYGLVSSTAAGTLPGGGIPLKRGRSSSVNRSRGAADDNELGGNRSPRFSFNGRLSRNSSNASFQNRLSRRRSSTSGITAGGPEMIRQRSNTHTRALVKTYSKPRVLKARSPSGISGATRTPMIPRRAPSTTCAYSSRRPEEAFIEVLQDTLKSEGAWGALDDRRNEKYYDAEDDMDEGASGELEPGEVPYKSTLPQTQQQSYSGGPGLASRLVGARASGGPSIAGNIFDDIQQLAESLQSELSEYKLKLGKEQFKCHELEAKKLELEFINHSYKRQLEKHENAKESWELNELNNRSKLEELQREKEELEEKLEQLQNKLEGLEESQFKLKENVNYLEQQKMKWHQEKMQFEVEVEALKRIVKEEEIKRSEVEGKIRDLEQQMDSCYHTCESRMADTENMKETYEVKIQELGEQVEELLKKLEGMRRENETQKTLMELMKKEQEEEKKKRKVEVEENQNRMDNYIS